MMRPYVLLPKGWEPKAKATITYLVADSKVLLIEKLRGHGAGKVNAPGGRLENGETPDAASRREVLEEVGVTVLNQELRAILRFHDVTTDYRMLGFVFVSYDFEGEAYSTDEAVPFWCEMSQIPYERMWEDDQTWLAKVLSGDKCYGEFIFDDDVLTDHRITSVTNELDWYS